MTKTSQRGYTVWLEDGELVEEELRARNSGIPEEEHGDVYYCSCGEQFRDEKEAIEHLEEA
jgi:hypothetical protein